MWRTPFRRHRRGDAPPKLPGKYPIESVLMWTGSCAAETFPGMERNSTYAVSNIVTPLRWRAAGATNDKMTAVACFNMAVKLPD
jgi:hypothetical protein